MCKILEGYNENQMNGWTTYDEMNLVVLKDMDALEIIESAQSTANTGGNGWDGLEASDGSDVGRLLSRGQGPPLFADNWVGASKWNNWCCWN